MIPALLVEKEPGWEPGAAEPRQVPGKVGSCIDRKVVAPLLHLASLVPLAAAFLWFKSTRVW